MTIEELGKSVKAKYPQYQNVDDATVGQKILEKYPTYKSRIDGVSSATQQTEPSGPNGVLGFLSGAAKTVVDSTRQFAESGAKIGEELANSAPGKWFSNNIVKPVVHALPQSTQQDIANKTAGAKQIMDTSTVQPEILKRNTAAEKAGEVAANVGMFLLPGGAAADGAKALESIPAIAKLGRYAAPAARALTEGVSSAAITAGQTGDIKKSLTAGALDTGLTAGLGILGKFGKEAADTIGATGAAKSATQATKSFAGSLPERMINNILRPTKSAFSFGKNPGRAVAELGIVANSEEELLTKISQHKQSIGEQIGSIIESIPNVPSVSTKEVFAPLESAIQKAKKFERTNQPLISRLEALHEDLKSIVGEGTESITPQQAFEIKKEIGGMSKWTGQAFDSEINQAKTQVYSKLRKAIESNAGTNLPQNMSLRKLNDLYGNLIEAESALENRIGVSQRNNMVSLGDLGTLGAGGAALGSAGALTAFVLKRIGGSVAFKTRLASKLSSILSKVGPEDVPALGQYIESVAPAISNIPEKEIDTFFESLPNIARLIRFGVIGLPANTMQDQTSQRKAQE